MADNLVDVPDDNLANVPDTNLVDVPEAPTMRERQRTFREQISKGAPEQAAQVSAPQAEFPSEALTGQELAQQWGEVGKGAAKGIPATLAGGMAGDIEELGRTVLSPFGVKKETFIPTTLEGGYLGPRGLNIMDPAKTKREAAGMMISSMFAPAGVAKAPGLFAKGIKEFAPSAELLKNTAVAAYKSPEVAALKLHPDAMRDFGEITSANLTREGFDPLLAPKTYGLLEQATVVPEGQSFVTANNFQVLRRKLGKAAGSADKTEREAARIAQRSLDEFMPAIPENLVLEGDLSKASGALEAARGNYAAASRSERLQEALSQAEKQAARSGFGGNLENSTRQRISSILNSPAKRRGFSQEEISELENYVKGNFTRNSVRAATKVLGGDNPLMAAVHAGLALPTHGLSLAAPVTGYALKRLNDAMSSRQLSRIDNIIRSRSPLAKQTQSAIQDWSQAGAELHLSNTAENAAKFMASAQALNDVLGQSNIKAKLGILSTPFVSQSSENEQPRSTGGSVLSKMHAAKRRAEGGPTDDDVPFDEPGIKRTPEGYPYIQADEASEAQAAREAAAQRIAGGLKGSPYVPTPPSMEGKTWMMEPGKEAVQSGYTEPFFHLPEGTAVNDAGEVFNKETGEVLSIARRPNVIPLTRTPEGVQWAMPKMLELAGDVMNPLAVTRGVPVKAGEMVLGAGPVKTTPEGGVLGAMQEAKAAKKAEEAAPTMSAAERVEEAATVAPITSVAEPRNLSYELDFGQGAPWNYQHFDWHLLPSEGKTQVSEAILPMIMDYAKNMAGVKETARLTGVGGWHEFTNPAFKSQFQATPEQFADIANITGYLGQQTKQFGYKWDNAGKKIGIAIHGAGFDDPQKVTNLWNDIVNNHPDFASGFSPSIDAKGKPGIELLLDKGGSKMASRTEKELIPAVEDLLTKHGFSDTDVQGFRATEESKSHDWSKDPTGESYLAGLRDKYGPEIQQRLDAFREQELDPALRREIDRYHQETGTAPQRGVNDPHGVHGLTVNDILDSNTPAVKTNSRDVFDIAKYLTERGSSALRRLGISEGKITGPDPTTDNLIAHAIAREVAEAIKRQGNSLEWYTKNIEDAMKIASLMHPELVGSENNQMLYKVALAITSQGEKVPSNSRLADWAYEYYKTNGKFPEEVNADKGKAMASNFQKVNSLIDNQLKVNGGDKDAALDFVRNFLDTKFTAKQLREMGYDINKELSDTELTGSSIFGPKIGYGFYQNLKGNYDPVTMDLWFMRSWGRITGTLMDKYDASGLIAQKQNFINSIKEFNKTAKRKEKISLPKNDKELINLMDNIIKNHEKHYKANKVQYKSGELQPSAVVKTAKRYQDGLYGLREAPANGSDLVWMRSVVNEARNILEQQGIKISNADLQALWWYPEKDLYEKLGGKSAEAMNTDYARTLAKMAREKGITDDQIANAIRPVVRRHGGRAYYDETTNRKSIKKSNSIYTKFVKEKIGKKSIFDKMMEARRASGGEVDDPFERAAQRQRNAVISRHGRQEGPFTGVLNKAVPAVGNALLNMVTFPGRYARGETGYVPGQMAAEQPKATDWAADTAMNMVGAPALTGGVPGMGSGIRAYHVSPHDFDRFDISKVGTGQGAQSYGHGLYFAENPKVSGQGGEYYREFARRFEGPESSAINFLELANFDRKKAIELSAQNLESNKRWLSDPKTNVSPEERAYIAELTKDREKTHQLLLGDKPVGPRVYEVNINARPEQFLDWDKPLNQQAQRVQDVFRSVGVDPADAALRQKIDEARGLRLHVPQGGGSVFPAEVPDIKRAQASEVFREAGIPGIKYLDQGSRGVPPVNLARYEAKIADLENQMLRSPSEATANRLSDAKQKLKSMQRAAAERTSNYVVFDDKLIDILRKYGILAPFVAGAVKQGSEDGQR